MPEHVYKMGIHSELINQSEHNHILDKLNTLRDLFEKQNYFQYFLIIFDIFQNDDFQQQEQI